MQNLWETNENMVMIIESDRLYYRKRGLVVYPLILPLKGSLGFLSCTFDK